MTTGLEHMRITANALIVAVDSLGAMVDQAGISGLKNTEIGIVKAGLADSRSELSAFLEDEDPQHIQRAKEVLEKTKGLMGI